jgi:hypothetical protein
MSENNPFGFAKLVPGFDFLQNLAKGASQNLPNMPSLSSWVAPTINVEELDKRISELKAVHFWLDQNSKALGATIQALEVQKMTLATLQGMNFSMGEVANALKVKTSEKMASGVQKANEAAEAVAVAAEAARGKGEPAAKKARTAKGDGSAGAAPVDPMQKTTDTQRHTSLPPPAPVDPMQWWGALTQQFQEIAANAMKDVAQKATDTGKDKAAGVAGEAGKAVKKAAGKTPSRKRSTSKG